MYAFRFFFYTWLATKALAQNPVTWSFGAVPSGLGYRVQFRAKLHPGWHLYSQTQPVRALAFPTHFCFVAKPFLTPVGAVLEAGNLQYGRDNVLGTEVCQYSGSVLFSQQVAVKGGGKTIVSGTIAYQVCSDEACLSPRTLPFSIELK